MQVCLMSDECSSVVSAALEFLHEEELILALIKHAITREVARTSPCSPPHITRERERGEAQTLEIKFERKGSKCNELCRAITIMVGPLVLGYFLC